MGKIKEGKLLYHLTRLSNLDSIIEHGLLSRKQLENNQCDFSDVAVKNTYDEEFIYICLQRSFARENKFKILPRHPLSDFDVEILDYDDGIEKIDWKAMESSSTDSDYCKNVRMAECLTESPIPVKCFDSIAVRNKEVEKIVLEKLEIVDGKKPFVDIRPWLKV